MKTVFTMNEQELRERVVELEKQQAANDAVAAYRKEQEEKAEARHARFNHYLGLLGPVFVSLFNHLYNKSQTAEQNAPARVFTIDRETWAQISDEEKEQFLNSLPEEDRARFLANLEAEAQPAA